MKNVISNAFEVYSLRRENRQLTEDLIRKNKELKSMLNLKEMP